MKMTMSRDGSPRATFRIEHRLDAGELIDALCANIVYTETLDELPEILSRTEVEKRIKKCLAEHGSDNWTWHEQTEDADEFRAWATRQINHHFFPATKN